MDNKPIYHKIDPTTRTTKCGLSIEKDVVHVTKWRLTTCHECLKKIDYRTVKYQEYVDAMKVYEPVKVEKVDLGKLRKYFGD